MGWGGVGGKVLEGGLSLLSLTFFAVLPPTSTPTHPLLYYPRSIWAYVAAGHHWFCQPRLPPKNNKPKEKKKTEHVDQKRNPSQYRPAPKETFPYPPIRVIVHSYFAPEWRGQSTEGWWEVLLICNTSDMWLIPSQYWSPKELRHQMGWSWLVLESEGGIVVWAGGQQFKID